MKHKISIIMSVLDGERYIDEAIESILAQTYKDYELIVINDGSTDSTSDRLSAFMGKLDMKVIHHPVQRGIAVSINDGLRRASGDSITFLDHDDVWFPHMLETQVSYLEQFPEVGMVHADFQTIDSEGNVIEESVALCRGRQRPSGHVFQELFMDSFIVATSVLIRKECFDRLGGFDEGLLWGDYHMWLRIARNYRIDYVPKVLAKYRQHTGQHTRSLPTLRLDQDPVAISALKKILELYPEARAELGENKIRRRMAALYFGGAYYWFEHRSFRNVRIYLARAIRLWPWKPRYYALYMASLLAPAHAMAAREFWRRCRALFSSGSRHHGEWKGEIQPTGNKSRS